MKAYTRKKSRIIKVIEWLHLWPSLVSSVILIFVCFTGTMVVFGDEIINYSAGDALYVSKVKDHRISTKKLLTIFSKNYPNRHAPGYLVTYKDPRRSVKFNSYDEKKGLRLVYIDPYTGEILKDDGTINFFFVTAHLHNSLLLGKPGKWIIDIATVIFIIGLITGVILWWPKKWTIRGIKKSFSIQWKANFKRLNYDLHNVLGFYALSVTFVLAVTGLLIAWQPLANAAVSMFGGDSSHNWEAVLPEQDSTKSIASMDLVIARYYKKYTGVKAIQINTYIMSENSYYTLNASSWVGLKNYIGRAFFINKYTGKEIDVPEGALRHEEIENAWWMLHMGTWMGLWGKILTFIAGLIATSLPVTGFIYWWGKRRKKQRKKLRNCRVKENESTSSSFVAG